MRRFINETTDAVQRRFFYAINIMIENGTIEGGMKGFCERNGLNRVKYTNMRNQIELPYDEKCSYKTIDIGALPALCIEGHISPNWLLFGTGRMIRGEQ